MIEDTPKIITFLGSIVAIGLFYLWNSQKAKNICENKKLKSELEKTRKSLEKAQLSFEAERREMIKKMERLNDTLRKSDEELESYTDQLSKVNADLETQRQLYERAQEENQKRLGYVDTSIKDNPDDFYDCVIDVPSLKSIVKGWEIKQKDAVRYNELKNNEASIVSVVGSYSKGKTFLFELLSNHASPHGFNVHTKGISLVYLNDPVMKDHTPIIGLDTKGGSHPLDISSLKEGNMNDGDGAEKVKEIFRDHQATEDIIQNFILEEANVIIVVVSDLTSDDQKLVNKLRRKFEKANRKKRIIVVHNLYHTHHVSDVLLKIENSITKAFNLRQRRYTFGIENKNQVYYEDITNKDFTIPHVIIAKQYSEAGDHYNEMTIKFIKDFIQTSGDPKAIDVVQRFKDFLLKNLNSYMTINSAATLESNLQICDEDVHPKIILKGEASLKPVSMDELGILRTLQGSFEPNYILSVITNDCKENEKLCLRIECPGKVSDLEFCVKSDSQDFHIEVKGFREEEFSRTENRFVNNITTGAFYVKTETLSRKEYNISDNSDPERSIKDGFITLTWPITKYSVWKK